MNETQKTTKRNTENSKVAAASFLLFSLGIWLRYKRRLKQNTSSKPASRSIFSFSFSNDGKKEQKTQIR